MSSKERTNPANLSRFAKLERLMTYSEDEFRDLVVRPLFFRQGLDDGRDLCGSDEIGKDAFFIHVNPLGSKEVYVLQTKKGRLNLSRNVNSSVVEAETQLKTALRTRVYLTKTKERKYPAKAILCASGQIKMGG
ncbi:MAG: hypothetical protein F4201_03270 [Nitrospira sp. SB0677_bin_15]|nr:hypothetical protein [Nitrospira sp. SB0661_bin_20]MYG39834.1 hypothetical protein [Nitrospira sp. SB0677_bin_15]MYH02894.1 hypothetical protein [Nitrospira sp. SB0675_bin_23]MYJ23831.1 hypothetical protein [Nitrospira sp. SB0673_bin_12]